MLENIRFREQVDVVLMHVSDALKTEIPQVSMPDILLLSQLRSRKLFNELLEELKAVNDGKRDQEPPSVLSVLAEDIFESIALIRKGCKAKAEQHIVDCISRLVWLHCHIDVYAEGQDEART